MKIEACWGGREIFLGKVEMGGLVILLPLLLLASSTVKIEEERIDGCERIS